VLLTIHRTHTFDPVKFLNQSGFVIKNQSGYAGLINELDTSRLRLTYDMYFTRGWVGSEVYPIFRPQRVAWLQGHGVILPDGHIIEALKEHPECLMELWDRDAYNKNVTPVIHLDGIELTSSWDGRDFEIYALYNRKQDMWEFPYLGPWAGINPSLVIDP